MRFTSTPNEKICHWGVFVGRHENFDLSEAKALSRRELSRQGGNVIDRARATILLDHLGNVIAPSSSGGKRTRVGSLSVLISEGQCVHVLGTL